MARRQYPHVILFCCEAIAESLLCRAPRYAIMSEQKCAGSVYTV